MRYKAWQGVSEWSAQWLVFFIDFIVTYKSEIEMESSISSVFSSNGTYVPSMIEIFIKASSIAMFNLFIPCLWIKILSFYYTKIRLYNNLLYVLDLMDKFKGFYFTTWWFDRIRSGSYAKMALKYRITQVYRSGFDIFGNNR